MHHALSPSQQKEQFEVLEGQARGFINNQDWLKAFQVWNKKLFLL